MHRMSFRKPLRGPGKVFLSLEERILGLTADEQLRQVCRSSDRSASLGLIQKRTNLRLKNPLGQAHDSLNHVPGGPLPHRAIANEIKRCQPLVCLI
jgi:hypothetical protein